MRRPALTFSAKVIDATTGELTCDIDLLPMVSEPYRIGLILPSHGIVYVQSPDEYRVRFRDGVFLVQPVSVWPSLRGLPTYVRRIYFDPEQAKPISD